MRDILKIATGTNRDGIGKLLPITRVTRHSANKYSTMYVEKMKKIEESRDGKKEVLQADTPKEGGEAGLES
jgi:hypothetical protein